MTGIEPRASGIGSDRSTNWATTTANTNKFYIKNGTLVIGKLFLRRHKYL